MGTHPIFESDFDCLTDQIRIIKTKMAPRKGKTEKVEEVVTLGPKVAEGENVLVFLSQPQYKQSIDHHRERTSSLSSDQTRRVPLSVLTILAQPCWHISVIKLTYIYNYINSNRIFSPHCWILV